MSYNLVYTRRASRDIGQLDKRTKERVRIALERFKDAPFRFAVELTHPELGTFRFRAGE